VRLALLNVPQECVPSPFGVQPRTGTAQNPAFNKTVVTRDRIGLEDPARNRPISTNQIVVDRIDRFGLSVI
jgi:hypothetical protein